MAGELAFPAGFLWGTATSSHQIEGGNTNNDWWEWEHRPDTTCADSSGDACDSWRCYPEDLDLVAGMGLGAYRFSLEWSRIEPAEGEFSIAALDHYRRVLEACHARGVLPVVTMHHYTIPRWLMVQGGFECERVPELFSRFVGRAAEHLGDLIGMACTLNEPNVMALLGFLTGTFPPGIKDFGRHRRVVELVLACHHGAVKALRAGPGQFPIGMTLSMSEMSAVEGGEEMCAAAQDFMEDTWLRELGNDDFVGVQGYTRNRFGPDGPIEATADDHVTQMGYEFWPGVAEYTVRRTAAFTGKPIYVTENGIGTADDAERIAYMDAALRGLHRCLGDGVDLRGYFAWSLLDNFEWLDGYRPLFGLHSVDRTTFERTPKSSARWYADVARNNRLAPTPG